MEPVTLSTERLILRPVGPQDADEVYAACQDPDIQRWTTVPSPYLREHAISFTETFGPGGWRDDSDYTFTVRVRDTSQGEESAREGALVAMVGVMRRGEGVAELGFWATKEHRGRGYMTEASLAAARWAFASAGVERLEWRAEVGNAASRAVAEKTGFTMEGTLRAALVHGGTRRDSWVGGLLPCDLGLPTTRAYLPSRG
ncbi:GNAT family N-acetyltransferase [Streptomyces sp. CBMA152]|uniref:GNAT family N-acetyltransferase n=1 Tax=Streptomyces sp. CBMA152 TaxID=1896312 RepID=UPI001661414A|nr:GNAT family N-acetyltransferase [Streptomyces sp. CBMA152]MBD0747692.1 GNAT family N-acetyltransferase [Streptomyces sp. CBMA152]